MNTAVGLVPGVGFNSNSNAAGPLVPAKGKDEDINRIIYVDFTPEMSNDETRKLYEDILNFRSWADSYANQLVQKRIESKELNTSEAGAKESYRAKAIDAVYRNKTNWLVSATDVYNSSELNVRDESLHSNILKLAIAGFPVGQSVVEKLEEVLLTVVNNIKNETVKSASNNYWFCGTILHYDSVSQIVGAKIRTISMTSNSKIREVASRKKTVKESTLKLEFSGQEYDWNPAIWKEVSPTIMSTLIEQGKSNAIMDLTFEVPI